MTLSQKMVLYSQNMAPSRIKKAIINMMEVEDGIPKVREALEKVKNPDESAGSTYKCGNMVDVLKYFTNTLINANNYKHCIASNLVKVLPVAKPEDPGCSSTQLESFEKLSSRLEDYDNQIPRTKAKLMDIYFDFTGTKFDESSATLENIFLDDGTFEDGKGSDCST